jgi:putative molybdopterin biosynthesis protein
MVELLTTDEASEYLRLSERKLYELVAKGGVPCTKITGRWLFPKAALDRWVASDLVTPAGMTLSPRPPIVGGSQDPLLDWALRNSGCGLASLPEGSEAGLLRLSRGEVMAAAIHLHRLEGDDETANIDAVAQLPGLHDAVVIALVRREQGLIVAPGNPLGLTDIRTVAEARARLAQRPAGAGAQLLLLALMARSGIAPKALAWMNPVCPTGPDLAQAVRSGSADCGIASRSVAHAAGLGFVPMLWERFDLVLRQRDYFLPGPQTLFEHIREPIFRAKAAEMQGYDAAKAGTVRFTN